MQRDKLAKAIGGMMGTACALLAAVPASAAPPSPQTSIEIASALSAQTEAESLLDAQNAERRRLGLAPLVWNPRLADEARQFAADLAARGQLHHSTAAGRSGHGENLWMGTTGAWDPPGMVDMFLEERRYFRAAPFPDVSLTGNWTDVGHYSQIVWRQTREVGCAIKTANGMDVLVCRYFPAGNVYGQAPF